MTYADLTRRPRTSLPEDHDLAEGNPISADYKLPEKVAEEAVVGLEAATVSEAAMADGGHIMDLAQVMVLAMVVTMMILLRPYIFNERIIHKKPQEHRLTIGIIAVIQKAITHISRSARMAGYRSLPCHKLHQLHNEDSSC